MQDILNLPPLPADARIPYGADPSQFADLRLPRGKGPFPVVVNIHGGYWRARYDLTHAGHLCGALTAAGFATWNLEYRRVGNPGGGWPGSFEDLTQGFLHLRQIASQRALNLDRVIVMGHSAGGQLAIVLAAHQAAALRGVISLAGVLDLRRGHELRLSDDAVAEFLGGPPERVGEHYREADPMEVPLPALPQRILHGVSDNVVPPEFSRRYHDAKKRRRENVALVEVDKAGHFELIDPRVPAWKAVEDAVRELFGSS
jgi:acetyl esterase/lipase